MKKVSPFHTELLHFTHNISPQPAVAGRWSDGGAEGRLQVAERQSPVHRLVNLSSAPLGQSHPAAHVEVHKSWYRVEGLVLQAVLDLSVCSTGLDHRLPDEEVECVLFPVAGEDKVALTGLRVSDEEVTVVHHQAL